MSSTNNVLCRYYVHGVCRNGADCPFSHDYNKGQDMVCKYYLRGSCSYGANCRYDHVRPAHTTPTQQPAPTYQPPPDAPPVPVSAWPEARPSHDDAAEDDDAVNNMVNAMHTMRLAGHDPLATLPDSIDDDDAIAYDPVANGAYGSPGGGSWGSSADVGEHSAWARPLPAHLQAPAAGLAPPPASILQGLCPSWFVAGRCQKGDACRLAHGQQCETCNKWALHPDDVEAAAQHASECHERHAKLAARRSAARLECSVCLEPVLAKANPKDRKFGLLSGCDHVFCLSCIRNWRSNTEDDRLDMAGAVRACPLCRALSHFVTPSTTWPASAEQKATIIDAYKAHLATIDCKHFDFGNGYCPFSSSCFYRHVLPDGTVPPARHATGRAQPPLTLGDFLDVRTVQRRMR